MYNQLYKLDIKTELGDYSLPFGEEDQKRKTKIKDGPLNSSQVSSKFGNEEASEADYEHNDNQHEGDTETKPNYTSIVKGLFNQQN